MSFETIETTELETRRDWALVRIEIGVWLTVIAAWLLVFAHGPHLP